MDPSSGLEADLETELNVLRAIARVQKANSIAQAKLSYELELENIKFFFEEMSKQIEEDHQTDLAQGRMLAISNMRDMKKLIDAEARELCVSISTPSIPATKRKQGNKGKGSSVRNTSMYNIADFKLSKTETNADITMIKKIANNIYEV